MCYGHVTLTIQLSFQMTLQDFFEYTQQNAQWVLFYFLALPLLALLVGVLASNKAAYSPWAYFFMLLIYLVSIPATMSVVYSIYKIFFQKADLLQTNLSIQVLPIVSLFATISIIKKFVALDLVPGFDKLSSMWLLMIFVFGLMWFLNRMQFIVFSYMSLPKLFLIFLLAFGLIYWAWQRVIKS